MSTWKYAGDFLNTKTIRLNSSNGYSYNISDFIDSQSTVIPFFQVNKLVGDSNPLSKVDLSYKIENGIFQLTGGIWRAELFRKESIRDEMSDAFIYDGNFFIRINDYTIQMHGKAKSIVSNVAIKWKGFFYDSMQLPNSTDSKPVAHNRLRITIELGGRVVYSKTTSGINHQVFGLFFKNNGESNIIVTIEDLDKNKIYNEGLDGIFNYVYIQQFSVSKDMNDSVKRPYEENDLEVDVFLIKRSVV